MGTFKAAKPFRIVDLASLPARSCQIYSLWTVLSLLTEGQFVRIIVHRRQMRIDESESEESTAIRKEQKIYALLTWLKK